MFLALTKIDASIILSPDAFFNKRSGFTTPKPASLFDIAAVPTGWAPALAVLRMKSSNSASVVALASAPWGPRTTPFHAGADMKRAKPLIDSRATKMSKSDSRYAGSISGASKGLFVASLTEPPFHKY